MKSNYKKLGEFIRPISVRNIDESVGLLLGLSVQKKFISSIANTIGTDMRTYKIIVKNQFAYIADTSRRGDKIGIALLENYDRAIISQAYDIFEVIDTQQLSPEYLMMWFRRPEFDRYARFKSHGSVRELFSWEDLCETELPVPAIEKQLEIVAEYNTLQNRISLNKQLINTLEATAQALYKQWFVDFEFPDQNGLPYKSNGGEMIDSPLGEIPKGWEVKTIGDMAEIKAGGDRPKTFSENKTDKCPIPIYSNGVTNNGLYGYTDKHNYPKNTITISARGTIGFSVLRNEDFDAIVRLLVLIPKFSNSVIYLWQNIKKIEFDNSGSVQNQLTIPQVSVLSIIMPEREVLKKYQPLLMLVYQKINIYLTENQKLVEFQSLLLSRLSTLI